MSRTARSYAKESGFMMVLQYNVRIRRNTIAFQAESEGLESLSNFSVFKPVTAEEVYAKGRNFGNLGYGDTNPYAKGGVKEAWNPVTGTDATPDELIWKPPASTQPNPATKQKDKPATNQPSLPVKPKEPRLRGGYKGQHFNPNYHLNRNNGYENRNTDNRHIGQPWTQQQRKWKPRKGKWPTL